MLADMRERKSESGFTLIELLVVMIIIAILMAVAVPTFLSQKSAGLKSQATSNVMQLKNAIESCASQNTDNTYTGCVARANLNTFEKGLASLPATYVTGGTTQNGSALAPTGYYAGGVVRDGQVNIWFGIATYADGTIVKRCGSAANVPVPPAAAPPNLTNWGGTPVANSRICAKAATAAAPNQW